MWSMWSPMADGRWADGDRNKLNSCQKGPGLATKSLSVFLMSSHHTNHHRQAIVLAFASSTDNFLVGLCTGLVGKPLPATVLWGIALCNATGSLLATAGGAFCAQTLQATAQFQYILAAAAFGYLALNEYRELQWASTSQIGASTRQEASLRLALPMTLNNLAGGVAGGVVGLSAVTASLYALFVSVVTMWLGYQLGLLVSYRQSKQDASVLKTSNQCAYFSILLYSLLSLQSVFEAVAAS
jgi:putative Mn2+ efflux pump MntP